MREGTYRTKYLSLLGLAFLSAGIWLVRNNPASPVGHTRGTTFSRPHLRSDVPRSPSPGRVPKSNPRISESYGKLPLSFEATSGQTDSQVKFLCRGGGYTLFLTNTEAVFQFPTADGRLPIAGHQKRTAKIEHRRVFSLIPQAEDFQLALSPWEDAQKG